MTWSPPPPATPPSALAQGNGTDGQGPESLPVFMEWVEEQEEAGLMTFTVKEGEEGPEEERAWGWRMQAWQWQEPDEVERDALKS